MPRIALFALLGLTAAAADQDWKDKQFPEWTEADAKEVIKDSPWAKTVTATFVATVPKTSKHETPAKPAGPPPSLTLRWESARPMREAELKARGAGAPPLDAGHYAIAVYGIPRDMLPDDSQARAEELKKLALIKRQGKRDTKPSKVEILLREDGPVVLYLFPKTAEFNWRDNRMEFEAQVSRLKFSQAFLTDEMRLHGTLEL